MDISEMFDYLETKQEQLNSLDSNYWRNLSKEMKEILLNLDIRTADAGIFWKSIDLRNGWSIQINSITNNCRILDDKRFRRCFGPRRLILGRIIDDLWKNDIHVANN